MVDVGDWDKVRVASHFDISVRRVEQLVTEYLDYGAYPVLKKNRRPKAPPLTREEKQSIDEVWEENRFGTRMLYLELKLRGHRIPHHKIHRYMILSGKTVPNPNKQKQRKRCRYEREHSFSLVHGDWHRTNENRPHVILWLEYDRPRWKYNTIKEFTDWYNNRMHGALWMQIDEKPARAILRKNQPENNLGLIRRLNQ